MKIVKTSAKKFAFSNERKILRSKADDTPQPMLLQDVLSKTLIKGYSKSLEGKSVSFWNP